MADDGMDAGQFAESVTGNKADKTPRNPTLGRIVNSWLGKIRSAKRAKSDFDRDASEALSFYCGDTRKIWASMSKDGNIAGIPAPTPSFLISVNKTYEAVKIWGGILYNQHPERTVTPRQFLDVPPEVLGVQMPEPDQQGMVPLDPMTGMPQIDPQAEIYMQTQQAMDVDHTTRKMQSSLLQEYLNYTPKELDLRTNGRQCVDEALITGAGVAWTEAMNVPTNPPAEPTLMVGSFYDSIANLYLDPDATSLDEINFCARRVTLPLRQVAQMFDIPEADLTPNAGTGETSEQNSRVAAGENLYPYESQARKQGGKTCELVTFYKVWSKVGVGNRLKGSTNKPEPLLDNLGENCYIVVSDACDYPLNLPPPVFEAAERGLAETDMPQRVAWPIPFWSDANGWPFELLQFNPIPNTVWPMSLVRPAIGELRFINYIISWLATRITSSCQTMIGVKKSATEDIKQQILADSKFGFKIVELEQALGANINEVLSVFDTPQVNGDVWQILDRVMALFDKRTGLTELAYGQSVNQLRSATEAQVKSDAMNVRPSDMLDQVDYWSTQLARKEAMAARWLLKAEDVVPVIGPLGALAWQQHLQLKPGEDIGSIARELEYGIANSAGQKLNKQQRANALNQALQTLMPIMLPMAQQTGDYSSVNALLTSWGETLELDLSGMLMNPPPPPPPGMMPPGMEEPPNPAPDAQPTDGEGTPPTDAQAQ